MNIILYGILLAGCEFCSYLNVDLLMPIINVIAEELSAPTWWKYWILESWLLSFSAFALIISLINQGISRALFMIFGTSTFIIGGAIMVLSSNIYLLLFSKVLQGLSTASCLILGCAFLNDKLDNIQAVKALSWIKAFVIIPAICAPLICKGCMACKISWRVLTLANIVLGSICFIGITIYLILHEERKLLSIRTPLNPSKWIKGVLQKSFLTNVFTQNFIETPCYLWFTFAPVHCIQFIWHHTFLLIATLAGMRISSYSAGRFNLNKVLSIFTAIATVCCVIGLALNISFDALGWNLLILPLAAVFLCYGIEIPILDRSIAVSIENQDKTITIGSVIFINYAVYSSVTGIASFILRGSCTIMTVISTMCIVIAFLINRKRTYTIK
ncbi:MAG: MFS transporter [Chlamydiia bacterium]|nr:MFS transporter [Chlamydiia bacterium]